MPQPLNVLIANSGRKWIGEIAHCVALYESLTARGHRVWIGCRRGHKLEAYAKENGLSHLSLGFSSRFSPWGDRRDLNDVVALIEREKIDLLHVHRGKDHWIGAFAARRTGVPLVRTRHVVTPVRRHVFNRRLYGRATDAVISVSRAAERSLGPLIDLVPNSRVILSAVDTEVFNPSHRSVHWRRKKAARGLDGEPIWIGLIGRIQRVKGQEVFMEAARLIAPRCPAAHFYLAGRSGKRKRVKFRRFSEQHGFSERFRDAGVLPNLPEVLASLDIGVVASIGSEGSSRMTLELMASGVPVVATRVGGIPEILNPSSIASAVPPPALPSSPSTAPRDSAPGKSSPLGILIAPGDPQAMADAILRLIDSPEERGQLAQAGREAVAEKHNLDRWVGEIESLYREVLDSRAGSV